LAADQSKQTELQDLATQFEAFQQAKNTEHQIMVQKTIQLETDVDTLKRQLGQLVVLIKKRLA
jgi:hypothetical protein